MAPALNLGSLTYFFPIFIFIFVFIILYALFQKMKVFGDNNNIHALVAFLFSILFVLVKPLQQLILDITPWFVMLFLLIVFLLLGVMILGFQEKEVTQYIRENSGIIVTIVIIILFIFFVGLSKVFPGSTGLPDDNNGALNKIRAVIFDPRVLGVFLLLTISYFVVRAVGFVEKKGD